MKGLAMICLAVCSAVVQAQTGKEWTQQKETRRTYLSEQITALKGYADYAKKGYEIASRGLGTIRDIMNGDLRIHRNYFESLGNVNPNIGHYAKVAGIISYPLKIIKQAEKALAGIKEANTFNADETGYCANVFGELLAER